MADVSYRGIEFREQQPPVDPKVLAMFEKEIGSRFPHDYRQFLFTVDGGATEPGRGVFASIRESSPIFQEILEFFCVRSDADNSIELALSGYHFNRRVPSLIIPIGRFIGDYMPCISLRTQDYGHIYVWGPMSLWDDEVDEYEQSEKDLFFLAKSFDEFLDMLEPLPEE